jgi:hypothetical protein
MVSAWFAVLLTSIALATALLELIAERERRRRTVRALRAAEIDAAILRVVNDGLRERLATLRTTSAALAGCGVNPTPARMAMNAALDGALN